MADQWELCTIDTGSNGWVYYYTPDTWLVECGIKVFLSEHYPNIQLPKKNEYLYAVLIKQLLRDGWEPFAATQTPSKLHFRRMLKS